MPEGAEVQGEGAMFRLPALAAFAVPVPASAAMQPRRTAVRGRPRMIRRCAREEQRGGSARRPHGASQRIGVVQARVVGRRDGGAFAAPQARLVR